MTLCEKRTDTGRRGFVYLWLQMTGGVLREENSPLASWDRVSIQAFRGKSS